jgi:hypothetical protein
MQMKKKLDFDDGSDEIDEKDLPPKNMQPDLSIKDRDLLTKVGTKPYDYHGEIGTYKYASATKLVAFFVCKACKKRTANVIHVEYTAFSFDTFADCSFCGQKYEVDVFSI